jgi:hypothetical protein
MARMPNFNYTPSNVHNTATANRKTFWQSKIKFTAKLQGRQVTWVTLNDFWGLGIITEHLYGLKITLTVKT